MKVFSGEVGRDDSSNLDLPLPRRNASGQSASLRLDDGDSI